MAIFNFFKKKPKEKKAAKKEAEAVGEKPKERKKEALPVSPKREKKVYSQEAYRVLSSHHISEKAGDLAKNNQYVFNVYSRANKIDVLKAVEQVYGVDAESVKIINVPRKRRRLGRTQGWKKGYKKAIVRIKEGQKIEIMPR